MAYRKTYQQFRKESGAKNKKSADSILAKLVPVEVDLSSDYIIR
jgi:hypothetical protein